MQNRVSDAVRAASTPDKTLHTALSAPMRPIRGIREHPPARFFLKHAVPAKHQTGIQYYFLPCRFPDLKSLVRRRYFGLLSNPPQTQECLLQRFLIIATRRATMSYVQRVVSNLQDKYAYEPIFLQAVQEVLQSLQPVLDKNPQYERYKILERIVEPCLLYTSPSPRDCS